MRRRAAVDSPTDQSPEAEVSRLTAREREVLALLGLGNRDREIADQLVVAESTVKKHVRHILRKLGARNRTEAVSRTRGNGEGAAPSPSGRGLG